MVSSQQILLSIGADHFPLKIPLKSASKSSFFALAPRSSFGAAISVAMARHSMAFCNSVSANRLVKAVCRFLAAAAACVILLYFAAESRESYSSGCIKVAMLIASRFLFRSLLCVKFSVCVCVCQSLLCVKVCFVEKFAV